MKRFWCRTYPLAILNKAQAHGAPGCASTLPYNEIPKFLGACSKSGPRTVKITAARDCPYSAPPLVCTTLSVKTAVNPKSHQHEIVAVAATSQRRRRRRDPDGGRGKTRLFQTPPRSRRPGVAGGLAAARPLGSEIAGAQDTPLDPKLPRDLHGELKKPHGFLADRGRSRSRGTSGL